MLAAVATAAAKKQCRTIVLETQELAKKLTKPELKKMADVVRSWPVFNSFEIETLPETARRIATALEAEDGLELLFGDMQSALSSQLCETGYALACEMAAADGVLTDEEMQVLELVRHRLNIDRLIAAGIERGARARYAVS